MRAAGRELWKILDALLALCIPGRSSMDLRREAHRRILASGAEPILLGYTQGGLPPFPGPVCICINEEVVHAPPSARVLRPGDVVTIDLAIRAGGWCADAARSIVVTAEPLAGRAQAHSGAQHDQAARLVAAAQNAADAGVAAMQAGARWSSVADAMGRVAADAGLVLIPGYSGHGIGRELHELPRAWSLRPAPPDGPGNPNPDFTLRPGMVLTLEPILTTGRAETILLDDGWTVLTADRAIVAHEERTVAITRSGPLVLTAP
jgi:methionyl aminopeptidase